MFHAKIHVSFVNVLMERLCVPLNGAKNLQNLVALKFKRKDPVVQNINVIIQLQQQNSSIVKLLVQVQALALVKVGIGLPPLAG